MTELRNYHRCNNRIPDKQVDLEVVLISEEKLPRNRWRMGVVVELHPGKDGFVRSCKVRTLTKRNKSTHIVHPIEKLFPLEIMSKETRDALSADSTTTDDVVPLPRPLPHPSSDDPPPVPSRPKRAAATRGIERRIRLKQR